MLPVTRQAVRSLARIHGASLSQAYHHDSHHQGPTLNDLPSPQIPWEEWNSKRQRKNNLVLITGIVFLGLTFGVAKETGLLHLNYSPPKSI